MRNKEMKSKRGITLIALVVTIVVLLILAGITINLVFADGGILQKASDAADRQKEAEESDKSAIESLGKQANTLINGGTLGGGGSNPPATTKTIQEIMAELPSTKNEDVVDSYGNKITIPAGFTIVPDGTDNVEYAYTGDGKPAVQDGIVIQDSDRNQFVWVPVGTINNKEGDSRGATSTIDLARYTFEIAIDSDTGEISGTGAVKNKIVDGSGLTDEWVELNGGGYEYLEELEISTTYKNTKAKEIEVFKKKSKEKGGYYIARYEASYRDGTKPYSKPSTGIPDETDGSTITDGMLWNFITQLDAANAARNMYAENNNFASDLVNSYAWDTAIVFIQTYSGQTAYSKQTSKNNSLANTGERSETTDKVCNIYDMASNTAEWTTTTATTAGYPCVTVGGFGYRFGYPSFRLNSTADSCGSDASFRTTLYVK